MPALWAKMWRLVWGLSSGIEFFCYSSYAPREQWSAIVPVQDGAADIETPPTVTNPARYQLARLAWHLLYNPQGQPASRVRIVVATSVMLTFISYWRAAAIVLNDLGSSAFYAGGIAEQAIGKSAPWFILAVMLFSFAVRAVYVESCSMFIRGGVYRVVKEALGGTLAKISVSALMFDYILTGPISGVSAGQYIAGLINDTFATADAHGWVPRAVHTMFHGTPHVDVNWTSVVFALIVTVYFWWQNTKGIQESSEKALRVMQITTVMVVILLGWSALTLLSRDTSRCRCPPPTA